LRIVAQLKDERSDLLEIPFTVKRLGAMIVFPDAEL